MFPGLITTLLAFRRIITTLNDECTRQLMEQYGMRYHFLTKKNNAPVAHCALYTSIYTAIADLLMLAASQY